MVRSDQSKQYLSKLLDIANSNLVQFHYEKLSVTGTAAALASLPAETKYAEIVCESSLTTEAVRYQLLGDKTLPTSTDGRVMLHLDTTTVIGYANLSNFRAIRVAAGTHTLHIFYFK